MKKARFSGLLFRELQLSKTKMATGLAAFFVLGLLGVLILLSFRYGNLSLLFENMGETDMGESIRLSLIPMIELMPTLLAGVSILTLAEVSVRDELPVWRRFRRSTPVSNWKWAGAKYTLMLFMYLAGVILSVLYTALLSAVSGTEFTLQKFAVIMLVMTSILIFGVLFQLFIMLFHSLEKAGLALMVIIMAAVVPYALQDQDGGENIMEILQNFSVIILPFIPLIVIAVLSGGFCASAMLFKRREK